MKLWPVLLALALAVSACASPAPRAPAPKPAPRPGDDRRPLVVLVTTDPWLMVVGSDSAAFALYDDGLVIFRSPHGLASRVLSREERDGLLASLPIGDGFRALNAYYEASNASDQPDNFIHVFDGARRKTVRVYGQLHAGVPRGTRTVAGAEWDPRARTPKPFLDLFDAIVAFDDAKATPWTPERIEVMVWPFEYSKDTPIDWPRGWPGLDDPTTIQWDADSYRIFLPPSRLDELKRMLRSMRETQAVRLGDKLWSISYRFPFPREELWWR